MNKLQPVKTMFMGVIIPPPIPERDFNGLIQTKQLSKQYLVWRDTHHYHFSLDYDINQQIVSGEWMQIYDDLTYNIAELTMFIAEFYDLNPDIEESMLSRLQQATNMMDNIVRTRDARE